MGTTTPLIFEPDYVKELVPLLLKTLSDSTARTYRIIWDARIQLLLQHLILAGGGSLE